MKYTHAVLKEVLRLQTPAPLLFDREAVKDCKIGDINVKKGTRINIPILALNMDPRVFPDPWEFRPERWVAEENSRDLELHPFRYIPFSAGQRNCIGQHLAILEGKIVIWHLLKSFSKIEIDEDYRLLMTLRSVYGPIDPIRVTFKPFQ
eukprot:TRINITY_DN5494_c0_g1_i2.p1 TRINITY_DN5494_c0_g1~~TRINITY_DN5494_c0_g1_i2.p1  ORF type:complete len:149 (-),score=13.88 TRINITY_DN5494_c0_g1_i2:136-582(-)